MQTVRQIALRLVLLCLVMALIAGTIGMSTAIPTQAHASHHMADTQQAATQASHSTGCPSDMAAATDMAAGHGACAMVMCCFTELDAPATGFVARVDVAQFALRVHRIPPETEPEKADKPPRHI